MSIYFSHLSFLNENNVSHPLSTWGVLITLFLLILWDVASLRLPYICLVFLGGFGLKMKGLCGSFLSIYDIFTLCGISLGLKIMYSRKYGKEGLGWGDVKLLTMAGLWVPCEHIPYFLFKIGLIGSIVGMLWRWLGKGDAFPFGAVISAVLMEWVLN